MDNDQQAQPVAEDVQQAPMPSAEQQSSNEQSVQEAVPQGETSEQETQGLPEDTSERTRQEFDKFKERNDQLARELREERSRREYAESVFNRLNPPKIVEPPKPTPLYDQTTGLLNEHALTEMQAQALQASEKARQAEDKLQQYQVAQERKEAYSAHPELNPESKSYNKEISIEVRKIILDNMTNPQDYDNRQLSFKEAADLAKGKFKPMIDQAQKQGAVQALEKITPKEQAALEVTGTPTGKSEINTDEFNRLRAQTRSKGDESDQAIIARMNAIK